MANPWFKFFAEFADDPKVQLMSEEMQRRLVMVFCLRCKEHVGSDAHMGFVLRISEDEVAKTKSLFLEKGLIDDHWQPVNWNKRQAPYDPEVRKRGYVYYVADRSRIKIGFSSNPWARLGELRVANPSLELLAVEAGERALESKRHQQFEELHITQEWFRREEPLIGYVATLRSSYDLATVAVEEKRVEETRIENKKRERESDSALLAAAQADLLRKRSRASKAEISPLSSIFSDLTRPKPSPTLPRTVPEMLAKGYQFSNKAACKDCGVEIDWWTSPKGARLPMDSGTALVHMETCGGANGKVH